MSDLAGKNVVIIGGTSGIGLATAQQASAQGASVWAVSRSADKVEKCRAENPGVNFGVCDTHDKPALQALFESVGSVDHIVGAATGAERTLKPFLDQTDEQFREAFNKFWGYNNVIRAGAPFLADDGSICLVSGFPARKANPGSSALSCVGSAVEALVRALAVEIAPKRINVVAPGIIDTGMHDGLGDNKKAAFEAMSKAIPVGRVGTSDECASAIMLVLTNGFMTGSTIDVEGGQLLP